ncbi:hypothetical protein CEXT_573711 [Caerostris extrusa]|uniref:Uncharacterized protein n=1 Tax=Caerostris extrusa TaxID=172846 RepID=A0AAV4YDU9_CAEEX|nr:hypothetical protein CEXT_573711 [Caerostris extrusa]
MHFCTKCISWAFSKPKLNIFTNQKHSYQFTSDIKQKFKTQPRVCGLRHDAEILKTVKNEEIHVLIEMEYFEIVIWCVHHILWLQQAVH